jgi:hypothetical protein
MGFVEVAKRIAQHAAASLELTFGVMDLHYSSETKSPALLEFSK